MQQSILVADEYQMNSGGKQGQQTSKNVVGSSHVAFNKTRNSRMSNYHSTLSIKDTSQQHMRTVLQPSSDATEKQATLLNAHSEQQFLKY